jgi:hypothetical protein
MGSLLLFSASRLAVIDDALTRWNSDIEYSEVSVVLSPPAFSSCAIFRVRADRPISAESERANATDSHPICRVPATPHCADVPAEGATAV